MAQNKMKQNKTNTNKQTKKTMTATTEKNLRKSTVKLCVCCIIPYDGIFS